MTEIKGINAESSCLRDHDLEEVLIHSSGNEDGRERADARPTKHISPVFSKSSVQIFSVAVSIEKISFMVMAVSVEFGIGQGVGLGSSKSTVCRLWLGIGATCEQIHTTLSSQTWSYVGAAWRHLWCPVPAFLECPYDSS